MLDGIIYFNGFSKILKYKEDQGSPVRVFPLNSDDDLQYNIESFYIANGDFYIIYNIYNDVNRSLKLALINIETGETNLFE